MNRGAKVMNAAKAIPAVKHMVVIAVSYERTGTVPA